ARGVAVASTSTETPSESRSSRARPGAGAWPSGALAAGGTTRFSGTERITLGGGGGSAAAGAAGRPASERSTSPTGGMASLLLQGLRPPHPSVGPHARTVYHRRAGGAPLLDPRPLARRP